jgi:hypothetical protein
MDHYQILSKDSLRINMCTLVFVDHWNSLDGNALGSQGAIALAEAVKINGILTHLE